MFVCVCACVCHLMFQLWTHTHTHKHTHTHTHTLTHTHTHTHTHSNTHTQVAEKEGLLKLVKVAWNEVCLLFQHFYEFLSVICGSATRELSEIQIGKKRIRCREEDPPLFFSLTTVSFAYLDSFGTKS
jgi:predicted methyltransferase